MLDRPVFYHHFRVMMSKGPCQSDLFTKAILAIGDLLESVGDIDIVKAIEIVLADTRWE